MLFWTRYDVIVEFIVLGMVQDDIEDDDQNKLGLTKVSGVRTK